MDDAASLAELLRAIAEVRRYQRIHREYMKEPRPLGRQLDSEARHVAACIAEAKKDARAKLDKILAAQSYP